MGDATTGASDLPTDSYYQATAPPATALRDTKRTILRISRTLPRLVGLTATAPYHPFGGYATVR